MEEDKWD